MKRFRVRNGFPIRRGVRALSVGVVALMVGGCDGLLSTDEQEYMARGVDYYQDGRLNESIIEFRNALQENPDNARARFYLGIARIDAGDYPTARRDLERAKSLGYSHDELALPLAQARWMGGEDEGVLAIELPQELGQTETAELHALRGRAALRKGDMELAREEYRKALAADPGAANARFGQVLLARADNDAERMREWVERTLSADENHAEAWRTRAMLDHTQGRNDDAEEALTHAIEALATPAPRDLYRRAMLRLQRDAVDEAREDAERLARLAPDFAGGHYALGLAYMHEGDARSAQAAMEDAVARDDRFSPARLMLGVIHGDAGRHDQARHQLERYRVLEPEEAVGSLMLAVLEMRAGNHDSAKEKLDAHVPRFPADRLAVSLRESLDRGDEATPEMTRVAFSMMRDDDGSPMAAAISDESLVLEATEHDAEPSEEELGAVRSALAEGQYHDALQLAKALIDEYPDSGALYNLKAGAHIALGDTRDGIQALVRGIDLDPGYVPAVHYLAQLLIREGREDSALAVYRRAHDANPEELGVTLRLARLEESVGNSSESRRLVREAMEQHPDALPPRLIHARLMVAEGNPEDALATLESILDAHADNPDVLLVQAAALESLGEHAQARTPWERLVELQPDDARLRMRLAENQVRLEDYASARETLRRASELEPQALEPRILLVRAYRLEQEYESAMAEYRTLLEDFEPRRDVLNEGANLALAQGNLDDAIERLREAQRVDPSERGALALAEVHRRADSDADALAVLEEWYGGADEPMSYAGRHTLAALHIAEGNDAEAVSLYEHMLQDNPDDVLMLNNLAWLLRETSPRRAVSLAERARDQAPASADVQHTLGTALANAGEHARALEAMEKAVELNPRPEFRLALAEAHIQVDQTEEARSILTELSDLDDFVDVDRARGLMEELSQE
ncbi:tetratricopeptide repeat protein [Thioalkalivibrio sp. ALJ24]|uniref:tetratricopeptide repeat protein n=1 Tax=Thioalkalivibrio sp. ALJ24 TaxID=545276 RepID=UPI000399C23A|nr:tetratricopeptide repeat protein [Thioalkalivibrio sp. ALJ24]